MPWDPWRWDAESYMTIWFATLSKYFGKDFMMGKLDESRNGDNECRVSRRKRFREDYQGRCASFLLLNTFHILFGYHLGQKLLVVSPNPLFFLELMAQLRNTSLPDTGLVKVSTIGACYSLPSLSMSVGGGGDGQSSSSYLGPERGGQSNKHWRDGTGCLRGEAPSDNLAKPAYLSHFLYL